MQFPGSFGGRPTLGMGLVQPGPNLFDMCLACDTGLGQVLNTEQGGPSPNKESRALDGALAQPEAIKSADCDKGKSFLSGVRDEIMPPFMKDCLGVDLVPRGGHPSLSMEEAE